IVGRINGNGPVLRRGGRAVFTTVRDGDFNVGTGVALCRRPGQQAGRRNRHAGRALYQREADIGAVVAVVRINDRDLVAVLFAFNAAGGWRRGDQRRVVDRRNSDREGLRVAERTVADLHGNVCVPVAGAIFCRRPADHAGGGIDVHAGRCLRQRPAEGVTIQVIGAHGVLVSNIFTGGGYRRRGNGRRVVFIGDGDVDGDVITQLAVADAYHEAVAANVIGIRRVGDGLAVAGTTDNDGAISGRGGHGPGQGAAVDIGGVQRQGEGGRRTVFGHADVDAVAFGNDRCVVDGINRDGPRLGCRGNTVLTTVSHLHGNGRAADAVGWRPGDQAGSGNIHTARRLRQRERQVGAVVGIVRIVYDELVAVLAACRRSRRCNGGNGRCVVAVVDSNGPALRCGRSTIFAT